MVDRRRDAAAGNYAVLDEWKPVRHSHYTGNLHIHAPGYRCNRICRSYFHNSGRHGSWVVHTNVWTASSRHCGYTLQLCFPSSQRQRERRLVPLGRQPAAWSHLLARRRFGRYAQPSWRFQFHPTGHRRLRRYRHPVLPTAYCWTRNASHYHPSTCRHGKPRRSARGEPRPERPVSAPDYSDCTLQLTPNPGSTTDLLFSNGQRTIQFVIPANATKATLPFQPERSREQFRSRSRCKRLASTSRQIPRLRS